ncbi:unnamed protein product [Prorocentrum cordatum]|uniref:RNA helicase n=1 Tax=Prorocentrum cordatum TaxID=2364126 RepID=A0ABN9VT58_9DINO|nr:unnamed protein product [Polarella glacialis]
MEVAGRKKVPVPFISRTPVVLSSGGQHCPASFMYTRDFEPGLTNIPGAGKDAVMLVFWKRVGDPRPDADGVRALLETEPALLAAGGSVALLLRPAHRVWNAVQSTLMLNSAPDDLWGVPMYTISYVLSFRTAEMASKDLGNDTSSLEEAQRFLRARAAATLDIRVTDPDDVREGRQLTAPAITDDELERCPGHVFQRHDLNDLNEAQTRVLQQSLKTLTLLVRGPRGTGKAKTIAVAFDLWLPCAPPDWAVGVFSGSNTRADMLKGVQRVGKSSPDSGFPLQAVRLAYPDEVTNQGARDLTVERFRATCSFDLYIEGGKKDNLPRPSPSAVARISGDENQLKPAVISDRAAAAGASLSVLKRFRDSLGADLERDVLPDWCYRVHPGILQRLSYSSREGKLVSGFANCSARKPAWAPMVSVHAVRAQRPEGPWQRWAQ